MQCLAKEATASALNGREAFVRLFEFSFLSSSSFSSYLFIFFFYPNTKKNVPFLHNRGDYFKNETNKPKLKERKKQQQQRNKEEGRVEGRRTEGKKKRTKEGREKGQEGKKE